jgi:hypothetical protein
MSAAFADMPARTKVRYRKLFRECYQSPILHPAKLYLEQMPFVWEQFYQQLKGLMGRTAEPRGFNETEVNYMGEHGYNPKSGLNI